MDVEAIAELLERYCSTVTKQPVRYRYEIIDVAELHLTPISEALKVHPHQLLFAAIQEAVMDKRGAFEDLARVTEHPPEMDALDSGATALDSWYSQKHGVILRLFAHLAVSSGITDVRIRQGVALIEVATTPDLDGDSDATVTHF